MIFIAAGQLRCSNCKKPFLFYQLFRDVKPTPWGFQVECECPWVSDESECS